MNNEKLNEMYAGLPEIKKKLQKEVYKEMANGKI